MNRDVSDNPAEACTLSDRVAFLSCPETYPDPPERVEPIETHMAWVFLSEQHAWKLKKPVRTRSLDFSTVEARRRDCLLEVELNQRLAPGVYQGIVPLTVDASGRLHLASGSDGPQGAVVDWLVQMRRLPRALMLDARIAAGP
jgi:aminoglycoside phosphotransferase family enzyme